MVRMVGRKAGVYIQGVRSFRASHEPGRKHTWWMNTKRSSTYETLKSGRESKRLDVEYGAIRLGTKGGSKGPTTPERQRTSYDKELEAARKLGEEMFDIDGRIIDAESSHRPSPVKQKRETSRNEKGARDNNQGALICRTHPRCS